MRNEVSELAKDKDIKRLAKSIAGNLCDDLLQEIFEQLLTISQERYDKITSYNLKGYVVKTMINLWYDKSKRFKNRYRSAEINKIDYLDINASQESFLCEDFYFNYCLEMFNSVSPALLELSRELHKMELEAKRSGRFPLDKELIYLYNKYGTTRAVEAEVGVSYVRVHLAIKKLKHRVNENNSINKK